MKRIKIVVNEAKDKIVSLAKKIKKEHLIKKFIIKNMDN